MTDSTALVELEKRLAEATGPDREIDRLLFDAMHDVEWRPYATRARTLWAYKRGTDRIACFGANEIPRYTASIDAALALVSRCLPDKWASISGPSSLDKSYCACIEHGNPPSLRCAATQPTPALALCFALVRALQSQSKREAGDA